jgi:hypothetical protein
LPILRVIAIVVSVALSGAGASVVKKVDV